MSIRDQAAAELDRTDFEPEDKEALLKILTIFFDRWDSGGAVHSMIPVLQRLLIAQPLSPLLGTDDEWFDPLGPGGPWLQNRRCPTVFKQLEDNPTRGLKKGDCYNIDDPGLNWTPKLITFPYLPPSMANIPSPAMELGDDI